MTDLQKDEHGEGLDRGRAWLTGIALGALAVAALVVAFTIGTNYSDEPAPVVATEDVAEGGAGAGSADPALTGPGRELFIANCGACHKLAEADTAGTAGPDLDKLTPDETLVSQAIAQGGTGSGMMPPGLVVGAKAEQVASYVAAAAGD